MYRSLLSFILFMGLSTQGLTLPLVKQQKNASISVEVQQTLDSLGGPLSAVPTPPLRMTPGGFSLKVSNGVFLDGTVSPRDEHVPSVVNQDSLQINLRLRLGL